MTSHKSVCLSVCLGVPRAHYTPLQRSVWVYSGYIMSVCLSVAASAIPKWNQWVWCWLVCSLQRQVAFFPLPTLLLVLQQLRPLGLRGLLAWRCPGWWYGKYWWNRGWYCCCSVTVPWCWFCLYYTWWGMKIPFLQKEKRAEKWST